jgi:hypothetical protein
MLSVKRYGKSGSTWHVSGRYFPGKDEHQANHPERRRGFHYATHRVQPAFVEIGYQW